ncbi:hypothetical protein [Lysobacter humi (ex Lee et al. 2017)]
MHHAVRTLEALARDPQLDIGTAAAELSPALRTALLRGDAAEIARLLGRTDTLACFIMPAENDEPAEPARAPDEPGEGDTPGEADA